MLMPDDQDIAEIEAAYKRGAEARRNGEHIGGALFEPQLLRPAWREGWSEAYLGD
jgi:hypothetical protein